MKKPFLFLSPLIHASGVKPKREKGGSILFLAIAAISVLSILALSTSRSVLQERKMARSVTEANVSYYAALSAEKAMQFLLTYGRRAGFISLNDLKDRTIAIGDVVAYVRLHDEQSNINIFNATSKEELRRLPGLGRDPSLVNTIWSAHQGADRFTPGFSSVKEELLLYRGMTPEIYGILKNYITVFGTGAVNINTASAKTLYVLGIHPAMIKMILNVRNGADPEKIIDVLESACITSSEKAYLGLLLGFGRLTTTSQDVAMDITIKKKERLLHSYKLIVNIRGGGIIAWHEA